MAIGILDFIVWLEKLWTRFKNKRAVVDESRHEEEQVFLALRQSLIKLRADRVTLYSLTRIIRRGRVLQDTKMNALVSAYTVDVLNTPPPPVVELPLPLDMTDLFDGEHLSENILEDFWEWPDRSEMEPNMFREHMRRHGVMGLLCHHVKNDQGSCTGMIGALYDDARIFTDVDRDTMKQLGRQLQFILPWLKGS